MSRIMEPWWKEKYALDAACRLQLSLYISCNSSFIWVVSQQIYDLPPTQLVLFVTSHFNYRTLGLLSLLSNEPLHLTFHNVLVSLRLQVRFPSGPYLSSYLYIIGTLFTLYGHVVLKSQPPSVFKSRNALLSDGRALNLVKNWQQWWPGHSCKSQVNAVRMLHCRLVWKVETLCWGLWLQNVVLTIGFCLLLIS